jgi:plasmid stabilization system protein ParE
VAAFRFSRRAEADLLSIGDYTLRTWGKAQAARYLGLKSGQLEQRTKIISREEES